MWLGAGWRPARDPKISRLVGELSYPVYILQGGVTPHIRSLPEHLGLHGIAAASAVAAAMAAYCAAAWAAWRYYDIPFRAWLKRREPRPRSAVAQMSPRPTDLG